MGGGGGGTKIGGTFVQANQAAEGSSVEATAGVLGDSTFLLAANSRATNDPANMSFTSVLIPANGGTPSHHRPHWSRRWRGSLLRNLNS